MLNWVISKIESSDIRLQISYLNISYKKLIFVQKQLCAFAKLWLIQKIHWDKACQVLIYNNTYETILIRSGNSGI